MRIPQEGALAADPYQTLGVSKDASQEAIQKAYRRLAKKLHPDLNPGNKQAEEQFKEVSAANRPVERPGEAGTVRPRRNRCVRRRATAAKILSRFCRRRRIQSLREQRRLRRLRERGRFPVGGFRSTRASQSAHARTGCSLSAGTRFPRCREWRQAAADASGRLRARRDHSARHPRRPDPAATRQGRARHRRRPTRRCVDRDRGSTAPCLHPQGRRHPPGIADLAQRSRPRRQGEGADAVGRRRP